MSRGGEVAKIEWNNGRQKSHSTQDERIKSRKALSDEKDNSGPAKLLETLEVQ